MDNIDSLGKIFPPAAAQGLLSKPVTDKDGQGPAPEFPPRERQVHPKPPEEDEKAQAADQLIDIIV